MSGVLGSEVERLPPEFRAISTNLAIAAMKLCASGAHGVRSGPSVQKVPRHRGACVHILPWPATEARDVCLFIEVVSIEVVGPKERIWSVDANGDMLAFGFPI
jgi:hypothetical protein